MIRYMTVYNTYRQTFKANVDLKNNFLFLKGLYHRRVFAVCLQIDLESFEWGLSARSVK